MSEKQIRVKTRRKTQENISGPFVRHLDRTRNNMDSSCFHPASISFNLLGRVLTVIKSSIRETSAIFHLSRTPRTI
jgi:hypothetical protein